jgi:hypothetical protein
MLAVAMLAVAMLAVAMLREGRTGTGFAAFARMEARYLPNGTQ